MPQSKLLSGGGSGKKGFCGGGGGGVSTFLALTDTPDTYVGQAARVLQVNGAETAVEFVVGAETIGLTDTITFVE